jgi:hypothetical protein
VESEVVPLTVRLAQPPTADQSDALERAFRVWADDGERGVFGGGHLVSSQPVVWQPRAATWIVDFATEDFQTAMNELARRIAGWSQTWQCPVVAIELGEPTT